MNSYFKITGTIVLLVTIFLSIEGYGQTMILKRLPSNDTATSSFGPNRKHFLHFYFGYAFIGGEQERGAEIVWGNSSRFSIGMRYKRKLTNTISFGADFGYRAPIFHLKQEENKIVPDSILHDKEKIEFHELFGDIYFRINYGKRGNYLGKFIDIGPTVMYGIGAAHVTKDEQSNGEMVEVRTTKLNYINKFGYGITSRLGFNKIALIIDYRLSDLFEDNSGFPELPRFVFGIQLGMH